MATAFTTAIEAWDKRRATAEGRADWLDPEPEIMATLTGAKGAPHPYRTDFGCGVGRHALLLAEHGLAVAAIDDSAAGLAAERETAQARGLSLVAPCAGFELLSLKQQQRPVPGTGTSSPNAGRSGSATWPY